MKQGQGSRKCRVGGGCDAVLVTDGTECPSDDKEWKPQGLALKYKAVHTHIPLVVSVTGQVCCDEKRVVSDALSALRYLNIK
ncbi:hypothetical protein J6590_020175 [Homalodisca vitripennis]|nr:hypothetical protein J6590_020175 [Homalodisca vitripennis]